MWWRVAHVREDTICIAHSSFAGFFAETLLSVVVDESTIRQDCAAFIVAVDSSTEAVAYAISAVTASAFISLVEIGKFRSVSTQAAEAAAPASGDIILYYTVSYERSTSVQTGNSAAITISIAVPGVTAPLTVLNFSYLRIGIRGLECPWPPLALCTVTALTAGDDTIGYHTVLYGGRSTVAEDCPAVAITNR